MKKTWKYVLSTLLVLILVTAGTIYYFLNIKTYDTADEEVKEIIKAEYEIELPTLENTQTNLTEPATSNGDDTNNNTGTTTNDSSNDSIEETATVGTSTSTNKSENKPSAGSKKPNNNTTTTPDITNEFTVAVIKDFYRPVFQSLETQANGKIEELLSRAHDEYQSKKANGETISFSYFYQKYSNAGRDLETKTDDAFNYVYHALEKDLKKYGYSPSHAKDFREKYEAAKKERESALLNKAKGAI